MIEPSENYKEVSRVNWPDFCYNAINMKDTILICPKNDEESLMILKIAEKIDLPTIVSAQPHGAVLDREKDLLVKITELAPDAKQLAIVELPGPDTEDMLRKQGFQLKIIDHHRYDDLDRMSKKSSLEQFLEFFEISDEKLVELGFDSLMVQAVAAVDRGFIWELDKLDLSKEDYDRALEFYRSLTLELGPERRMREEEAAQVAWENREERDGVIIVESEDDKSSIRDALSFIIAKEYGEPRTIIIKQGDRRLYVQASDKARALYDKYGGFMFGQEVCWGILRDDGNIPSIDEVLKVIV